MGTHLKLTASDGHKFDAYRVDPTGTPKGGIVVIQEIFGVNRHIRSVADRFAALGYVAIAPALFDRIEAGFECGYSPEEVQGACIKRGGLETANAAKHEGDICNARSRPAEVSSRLRW